MFRFTLRKRRTTKLWLRPNTAFNRWWGFFSRATWVLDVPMRLERLKFTRDGARRITHFRYRYKGHWNYGIFKVEADRSYRIVWRDS